LKNVLPARVSCALIEKLPHTRRHTFETHYINKMGKEKHNNEMPAGVGGPSGGGWLPATVTLQVGGPRTGDLRTLVPQKVTFLERKQKMFSNFYARGSKECLKAEN